MGSKFRHTSELIESLETKDQGSLSEVKRLSHTGQGFIAPRSGVYHTQVWALSQTQVRALSHTDQGLIIHRRLGVCRPKNTARRRLRFILALTRAAHSDGAASKHHHREFRRAWPRSDVKRCGWNNNKRPRPCPPLREIKNGAPETVDIRLAETGRSHTAQLSAARDHKM